MPREWQLTSIVGVALGVSSAVAYRLLLPALAEIGLVFEAAYWPPVPDNALGIVALLISIWLLTVVGEEFFYRGYLILRLGDVFGTRPVGVLAGLIVSALIFALAHEWVDLESALGFVVLGIVEGVLYLFSGRNLLLPVLFRGSWDTVLILLAWAKM
jgi:membrane protease YdiL (CAAX protease family)